MRLQKPVKARKRKKHKPSILHQKDGTCYLCIKLDRDYRYHDVVQEHHIYNGPNRRISEAEGLKVYLCLRHHTDGAAAVHNNHENMRFLQREGQQAYENTHSRQQFMELIGRNYLDEPAAGIRKLEEEKQIWPPMGFIPLKEGEKNE